MGDAEMSQEVVKDYLVENGGITRNVDLVRHFRKFLQSEDLASKERNRETFKNFVNALAAVKSEGGEKFIILKPKFYPVEWGGVLPSSIKSSASPSGRHGSNPDISEHRASSPTTTRPLRQTVHIPGLVVPAVDSDNESDCVTSLSTFSLDSSVTSGYARKATNPAAKLMQNGGKAVRTNRTVTVDGPRGAFPPPVLLPGAGLVVPPGPKTDAPSSAMPGQSAEERDETSSISTASFSAFDYEMMDPLEHDWIMSAVQCSHETSQRLLETEPNFINKRDMITTALHWAAMNGNDVMLSTLLLNGADVNAKSTMGLTPLHMAAQRGYDNIIQLLIKHYDAQTDIRDNNGKRPRDVAKKTVSERSRDLLDLGLECPSGKSRKRKNAILSRKKSRSFSGGLPSIHIHHSDEVLGGDDSVDSGGVRRFFRSPLLSIRRSFKRRNSLTRSGSGTVFD